LHVCWGDLALDGSHLVEGLLVGRREQVAQDPFHGLDRERTLGQIGRADWRQHVGPFPDVHDESVPIFLEDCGNERFDGRHVSHPALSAYSLEMSAERSGCIRIHALGGVPIS
jgi:hypothetical protein